MHTSLHKQQMCITTHDIQHLSESVDDRSLHIHFSVHTQTVKHAVVLPPCLPLLNPCAILSKEILEKRELDSKIESATKKQKLIKLKVKSESYINGNIE